MNIHGNIIYNSQKRGNDPIVHQMMNEYTNCGMEQHWNCKIPDNWILFGSEKDTSSNMNELWKHYVKWKKPVIKDQILYDSTYVKYPK